MASDPSAKPSAFRREGPITVIGATGQQGGAVIDALLEQRIPDSRGHSKPERRQGSRAR